MLIELLIVVGGIGFLIIALRLRSIKRWWSRVLTFLLISIFAASLLLPGVSVKVPTAQSDYSVTSKDGRLFAPNLTNRVSFVGEQAVRLWDVAYAAGDAPDAITIAGEDSISEEDFGDLYELPFDVPPEFYQSDAGNEDDAHSLIKMLSRWNELSDTDVTQGQTVMGVGGVAPDGEIIPVEDIEAYTRAAIEAKPKVFFVPVESYLQVKDLDKDLLVVPVSHFEEVLYFLSEPVEFWPLRNFGLFCH